jgi:hypothetical protein
MTNDAVESVCQQGLCRGTDPNHHKVMVQWPRRFCRALKASFSPWVFWRLYLRMGVLDAQENSDLVCGSAPHSQEMHSIIDGCLKQHSELSTYVCSSLSMSSTFVCSPSHGWKIFWGEKLYWTYVQVDFFWSFFKTIHYNYWALALYRK